MAIATGTALLIGAGIEAGTKVFGAKKEADAAKEATKASAAGNDAALQFAKEQEAQRRADYERAMNDYYANRSVLAQRYGIALPARAPAQPYGATSPAAAAPSFAASNPGMFGDRVAAYRASLQGGTLADVAANRQVQADQMSNWNDWRSYGLPSA